MLNCNQFSMQKVRFTRFGVFLQWKTSFDSLHNLCNGAPRTSCSGSSFLRLFLFRPSVSSFLLAAAKFHHQNHQHTVLHGNQFTGHTIHQSKNSSCNRNNIAAHHDALRRYHCVCHHRRPPQTPHRSELIMA